MFENKAHKSLVKQFPLDGVQYEQLPQQKRVIVKKLLYLFIFYASKGSKHGYSELPEYYFMEMIGDLWKNKGKPLPKNKAEWKDLQILYYSKGCKNSLSFKNFLELLPTLGIYAQPEMSRQDSLKSLMHHLINLFQTKVRAQVDGKLIDLQIVIQPDTREFLSKLSPDLIKLYKLYFPHQIVNKNKTKRSKQQSFSCFLEFLKDFQVFPKIISARDLLYIFIEGCDSAPSQLLYQNQDSRSVVSQLGQTFRLSKFIQSLIIISKRVFPRLKQVQNQQQWEDEQKYLLRTLLEYMQTAKTTNKKNAKFINQRFCFIVLDQHPKEQMMKTIQVGDKVIKEPSTSMDFFSMMKNMKL